MNPDQHPKTNSCWQATWFLGLLASALGLILLGCATPLGPTASAQPTSTRSVIPAPSATVAAPSVQTSATSQAMTPATPARQLQRSLELADAEMNAVRNSATLKASKTHAEAVVNILVGFWGRWYGDGDRDGNVNDPSDKRGVLPGERIPEAAPDVGNPVWPYGWGVMTYDAANEGDKQFVQFILGNTERWKSSPRTQYDAIAQALAVGDLNNRLVNKLDGSGMRTVAWGRLILTKAQSLDEAKSYASMGAQDSNAALEAARKIK